MYKLQQNPTLYQLIITINIWYIDKFFMPNLPFKKKLNISMHISGQNFDSVLFRKTTLIKGQRVYNLI